MRLICFMLFFLSVCTEGFSQTYLLDEDVNKDTLIPNVGYRRKFDFANYSSVGWAAGPYTQSPPSKIEYFNSWQFREGFWGRVKLNKWYSLGTYIEYARDEYRMKTPMITDTQNNSKTVWTKQVNNNVVLGIFNRVNLKGDKNFLDLGVYYAFDCLPRIITKIEPANGDFKYKKTVYTNPLFMNRSNYGIDLKITFGKIGIYSRYRITSLFKNQDYDLPKMMIGLVIDYKD